MSNINVTDQGVVIEFASSEPRHYDRIPSIIDHLTYIDESVDKDTGETVYIRRRLTPTEKELYRILRYRAGSGACWRDSEDLASHVGCSKNTVTEAKKALTMAFEQLEGSPLIDIQEKMVRTVREGKCINRRPVHCITIRNIWPFNNAFMDAISESGKKRQIQKALNDQLVESGGEPIEVDPEIEFPKRKMVISKKEASLAIEKMSQPGPVELVHNRGADTKIGTSHKAHTKNVMSPLENSSQNWDVNKDNLNKDHCLNTDPKANALARCLLTSSNVEECFASQSSALTWLQQFGYKCKTAREVLRDNTIDQLLLAALYLKDAIARKQINSITGYYLLTLKNRWYLPRLT